jgi:DNA-directed RNA polymerase specialized sigma24 family protein
MSGWPDGLDVEDMHDIIAGVAVSLTRQYRTFVEVDDVRQILLEWCWRRREKVAEYLVREDKHDRKAGTAALMKSLYREGSKHCRKEKAAASGYEIADEVFYSTALVEDMLKLLAHGGTALASRDPAVRSESDPAEGGNLMVMVADIQSAMEELDEDTQALLLRLYGEGEPAEKLAAERGVTPQAVRQKAARAAVRLVRKLGGESPWR